MNGEVITYVDPNIPLKKEMVLLAIADVTQIGKLMK